MPFAPSQLTRRLAFETLEPRVLMSADVAPLLLTDIVVAPPAAHGAEFRTLAAADASPVVHPAFAGAAPGARELAIVDSAVPDRDRLVELLQRNAASRGGVLEVVLVGADSDGIAAVTTALAGRTALDAVHLVSHGDAGQIALGRTRLDFDALVANAGRIKGWGQALGADADLLLYGCDVASTAEGRELVEALARLTGADVAASDDPTGSASLGGDWVLEARTGAIEAAVAPDLAAQAGWAGLLAATPAGSETAVNTTTANTQSAARVAAGDAAGRFVVVWESNGQDGSQRGIFGQLFDAAGNKLGGEFQVNTYTSQDQTLPAVAMDASGNFVVVWESDKQVGGSEKLDLFAQRFDATGAKVGAEFLVNTYTANDQSRPAVAMSASGAFVVAWQSEGQDGDAFGVYAQRFDAAGARVGGEFQVSGYAVSDQAAPSVAMDAAGGFVIVWHSKDQGEDNYGIFGRRYSAAGATVGPEFRVNTWTTKEQQNPVVAMNATGAFVVAWQSKDQDGDNWGIHAQRYDAAGVPTGAEVAVNAYTSQEQQTPAVAIRADGAFSVIWESRDQMPDSHWGVYRQDYSGSGTPDGPETRVNTTLSGPQERPAIAINAQGATFVAWSGAGAGDGDGIFTQRFAAANQAPVGAPVVTGTAIEDQTLGADTSGISDANGLGAFGYQWLRNGVAIGGAAASTYTLGDADVGAAISVRVAYVDGIGTPEQLTSAPTAAVAGVNDAPVAQGDAYAASEDGVLTVAASGVLANDSDADGPALAAMLVAGPAHGALALAGDGSFTYVPHADYFGVDTFTYLASDGGASSNVATVTITVANVADTLATVTTAADLVDGDTSSIDALLANRGADGFVSLREAMLAANAAANGATPDRIHFGIAGAGPHVIDVLAPLPTVTDAVIIDAATQPGYAGAPVVQIDGGGGAGNGLRITAGNSTVRGLAITGFAQSGIFASGGGGNRIQGNYIGVDLSGNAADGNATYGVRVTSGGNLIGGTGAADRNVISGNAVDGVYVGGGTGNVVQGNYIGTNAAGSGALANGEDGVWISGATNTTVGGTVPGAGNVISGNAWSGVATTVGAPGTRILGNAIFDNGRIGIDLGGDGVTTAGLPQIAWASTDGTIQGSIADAPSTTYRIEFFSSPAADPTGYGEGRRYLGYADVTTDAAGTAAFTASVAPFVAGESIAATATSAATGGTSEFSAVVAATPPNTAPAGADAGVSTYEDTTYAFVVADFPLADADAGDTLGGVRVDSLPAAGALSLGGVALTAGQFVTAADITAGLLTFAAPAGASGAAFATFTFTVRDSGVPPAFAPVPRTMTIDVAAVNDAPDIGALAGDVRAYAEGAALANADAGGDATVTDADSPDFDGGALTVSIIAGADPTEDVVAIRNQGSLAGQIGVAGTQVRYGGVTIGTFSGGTGGADLVVTFNANATPAAVQALVRNVGYRNTDTDTPTPGPRTIRFVVTDGDGGTSAAVQTTVNVAAVNDAPTAAIVPSAYAATENAALTLSGTGISVGDVDAGTATVTVTLSVISGTLGAAAGTTGVAITGGGASIRFDGTVAQVNALLAGTAGGSVTYVMTSDSPPAADTLSLWISDNGASGGGALMVGDAATINITAVNDGPLNTLPGVVVTTEDTPLVFGAGQVAVADVDAGAGGVRVSLGVTNGALTLSGTAGLVFVTGDGTGDASMVFTGTVSAVNAALGALVFAPAANSTATAVITMSTEDLGNTGLGGPLADLNDTATILVQPANDIPVSAGGSVTTPRNVPHAFTEADFGFVDTDAGDALSAVRIDAPPVLGSLALFGTAVTAGQVIAAADIASGGLVFTPGLNDTGAPYTSFTFSVADASAAFAAAPAAMTIGIANSAPSGADGTVLTIEATPYVFLPVNFGFNDVDAGDALGAVRIDTLPVAGTLLLGGAPVAAGTVIAAVDIAAGNLVYAPPVAGTGAPFAAFSFSVGDTYGPDFDPAPNTLAIHVSAATAAPVNLVPGAQTASEDAWLAVAGIAVADVNGDLATLALSAGNGTLVVSLAGGAAVSVGANGSSAFTLSGTQAQLNAAVATLAYRGYADFFGADAITLQSTDATLLQATSSIAVVVGAVNDAPTAVIVPAVLAAIEGVPLALGGAGLAVGDIDSTTATVTLSVVSGTLAVSGAGVTIAGSGSATVLLSGAIADINALLAGAGTIEYLMGSDAPPATDTLRLAADDGAGGTAVDIATIDVTAVDDAPVNTLPGTVTTLEDTPILFAGATQVSVTDVDAGAAPVQASLAATHGVLDLSGVAGLTFTAGDGVGDATMTFRGALAAVNAALDGLRYTPAANHNGLASLTLVTNDLGASGAGGPLEDRDSMTIAITPVNDAPAGTDATQVAIEDAALVLARASFGFVDVDGGDTLSAVRIDSIALPPGAALRLAGVDVTPGQLIAAADLDAGRLVFQAAPDANGAGYASLTFSVRDTGGPAFDPAPRTLVFDVAVVNDAPVISSNGGGPAAAVAADENTAAPVTTVTGTDVDSPAAGRVFAIAGGADAGRFVIDAATGVLRFAAAPDFEAPADAGADNVYDVRVELHDGAGGRDWQDIAVTVGGVDEAPVATADAYTALEDVPLVIAAGAGVLANDADPEGAALAATLVSGPASGTVTVNADGSFVYTPNANFFGTDSFRYRAGDGVLSSGIVTVVVDVAPENRAPVSADGSVSATAGLTYVFTVDDFGYSDQDGDALARVTITSLPQAGSLLLAGAAVNVGQDIDADDIRAGLLRYVAPPDAAVAVTTFGFVVSDGVAAAAAASTITIGIAAAPVGPITPDPGSGAATTPPPPSTETPSTTPARAAAAEADALAADLGSGGGRAGGSAAGSDGGDGSAPQAAAEASAPAAAAASVAAPTAAAAAGFASSGGVAGLAVMQRDGVVDVREPAAPEASVVEAAKLARAVEALAAPEFREELDRLREQQVEEGTVVTRVAGSVMVVTSGLSVGYVLWLLRGGVLLASLLTSLPAWRVIDPIAVLGRVGDEDEDDDSLQDMVSRKRAETGGPEAEASKEGGR